MKCVTVFVTILAFAVAYTDIDDKYNAVILGDKQKLRSFLACIVDKEPCDAFGQHVKSHMVELLKDGCKECDPNQKHYSHLFITLMKNDHPDLYEAYEAKYDPKRKLLKKLDDQVVAY